MSCSACEEAAKKAALKPSRWGFLWSYIKVRFFSKKVSPQLAAQRLAVCQGCQFTERDEKGLPTEVRLFREVAGTPYCGVPRTDKLFREETRTGCGCNLKSKVKYEDSFCPRNAWGPGDAFQARQTIRFDPVVAETNLKKAAAPFQVTDDLLQERLRICAACTEINHATGNKLYRVTDTGVPRCGTITPGPKGTPQKMHAEGCGCDLNDFASINAARCPRLKWGPFERLDGLSFEQKISTALVRLDANGIGDLCIAAVVVAGLKKKNPSQRVAVSAPAHLTAWSRYFADFDTFVPLDRVVEEEYAFVCRPNEAKLKYEFPSRGKESWVLSACRLCGVTPAVPKMMIPPMAHKWFEEQPLANKRFAVLSPFAMYQSRSWPLQRWMELARRLPEIGVTPVVVDTLELRVRPFKDSVARYLNLPPENLLALMQHAAFVIGNDSGIAHVGGALQKKTLVVMGPTNGASTFQGYGPCVSWIDSTLPCSNCYWKPEAGYRDECRQGCDALWGISVSQVLDRLKAMERAPNEVQAS